MKPLFIEKNNIKTFWQ